MILGPPRAGNQLLSAILDSTGCKHFFTHSHDAKLPGLESGLPKVLLQLYRRNVFRHCLSAAVSEELNAWRGEQFLDAAGNLPPRYRSVRVSPIKFQHAFYHAVSFHTKINREYEWHRVQMICYEDFCHNSQYVFDLLQKPQLWSLRLPIKTPFSYRENVTNWKQLYDLLPGLVQDVQQQWNQHISSRHIAIDPFWANNILPNILALAESDQD